MRVTGYVIPDWKTVERPLTPPVEEAAARNVHIPGRQLVLQGGARAAWFAEHRQALQAFAPTTLVSAVSMERTALLVASAGLPRPGAEGTEARSTEAPPAKIWLAAGEERLSPERERALRQALTRFVAAMGAPGVPLLIDCVVPDEADEAASARHEDILDLDQMQRIQLEGAARSLGEAYQAADGSRWTLFPYVSPERSRMTLFLADLYRQAGAAMPTMRLAATPGGLLHAAMEIPPGLQIGLSEDTAPEVLKSVFRGLAADAWLFNAAPYANAGRSLGIVDGRALRLDLEYALSRLQEPERLPVKTHYLSSFLQGPPVRAVRWLRPDMTLAEVGDSIRAVMQIDDDTIRALARRHGIDEGHPVHQRQIALLIARRQFMGSLSIMDRTAAHFYEQGTSPHEISGEVVQRAVYAAMEELAPPESARPRWQFAASRRSMSTPHAPDAQVIDAARALIQDCAFLSAPTGRGGVRNVYQIPGHPFMLKISRRGAEAVVRWRERYGGGEFPDSALAEGERYAARQNERYQRLADHLGHDIVYVEHTLIVPEARLPTRLLTDLTPDELTRFPPTLTLPLVCTIQSIFPYVGRPGSCEYRVPYSEWNPTLTDYGAGSIDRRAYAAALYNWVLNTPVSYGAWNPLEVFMQAHPRATVAEFLRLCTQEPDGLRPLATKFFERLIGEYCPETGESIDTSGPQNGFWYVDEAGRRRAALLDSLYPDDYPILATAQDFMRKFLRGEPLTLLEKANLLNAINFARATNFMAEQLGVQARLDIFPDAYVKQSIGRRANDLFQLLNAIRFEKPQPHPDRPWGYF